MFQFLFVCRPLEDTISHRSSLQKGWEVFKRKQPPKNSAGMRKTTWRKKKKGQETTKRQQGMGQHKCSSQTSLSFFRRSSGWVFCSSGHKVGETLFLKGQHFPKRPDRNQAHSPSVQRELHGTDGATAAQDPHDVAGRATEI